MDKFIVDEETIVKDVKFGLAENVKDSVILDRLISPIIDELDTVLWDDCETLEIVNKIIQLGEIYPISKEELEGAINAVYD